MIEEYAVELADSNDLEDLIEILGPMYDVKLPSRITVPVYATVSVIEGTATIGKDIPELPFKVIRRKITCTKELKDYVQP